MNNLPVEIKEYSTSNDYDTLVIISLLNSINGIELTDIESTHLDLIKQYEEFDKKATKDGCLIVLPKENKIRRLIYSPVGPLNRDYDDVRRFFDAANNGVKRALAAGGKQILICLPNYKKVNEMSIYSLADHVTFLGSLDSLYVPIEIREVSNERCFKANYLSFYNSNTDFKQMKAIEIGRNVARDIGGSDPERMSPRNVADYVSKLFENSLVKLKIIDDDHSLKQMFPCFAAVNRGSSEKHRGNVMIMTYEPKDTSKIKKTLILVGKGVCYDTGGHDLKVNGVMLGMHRDKCGAAAVAGFMKTVEILKPENIRVIGTMSMVRNSIGPDAYVSDEIITARSGARVRVRNTDAEGRMAMVDVLCYLKEETIKNKYVNPSFMTIATLTGHACLAVGDGYSAIMSNGPARQLGVPKIMQESGEKIGDMFEISSIKREDYEFNIGTSEYEDLFQCNTEPSSRTPRGHQVPAAFLIQASGFDKHGIDSENPLPYSHLDIAASSGPYPGVPTGAPIAALSAAYLL